MRSVRTLGAVVSVLGAGQLAVYAIWTTGQRPELFYFDPRIGLAAFSDIAFGPRAENPTLLQWTTGIWQLLLGVALSWRPKWLTVYLISEALLALPSIAFFVLVASVNSSPSHGFSVGELLVPVLIFIVFTAVPFVSALRLKRRVLRSQISEAV